MRPGLLPLVLVKPVLPFDVWAYNFGVFATKRVCTAYSGPLIRLRRSGDSVEADFTAGSDGWLSGADITAWLGGGSALVRTWYDQSGRGHHANQATAGNQPALSMALKRPVVSFTASSSHHLLITPADGYSASSNGIMLVTVRKHATTGASLASIGIAKNTTGSSRATLSSTATNEIATGRRLDADAATSSTGMASDTNWHTQIARFEWATAKLLHSMDLTADTLDPFLTAGASQATNPANISIGSLSGTTAFFDGLMSCAGLVREYLIPDSKRDWLVNALLPLRGDLF